MRAFHVVGVDFELGLRVRRRLAAEQHRLDRLHAVGLLRVARDRDLAEVAPRRRPAEHRSNDLVARCVRLDVADGGHDLQSGLSTADLHRTEFEMRAVVQRDIDRDAPVTGTCVQHMKVDPRTGAEGNREIMDTAVGDQMTRNALSRSDRDFDRRRSSSASSGPPVRVMRPSART